MHCVWICEMFEQHQKNLNQCIALSWRFLPMKSDRSPKMFWPRSERIVQHHQCFVQLRCLLRLPHVTTFMSLLPLESSSRCIESSFGVSSYRCFSHAAISFTSVLYSRICAVFICQDQSSNPSSSPENVGENKLTPHRHLVLSVRVQLVSHTWFSPCSASREPQRGQKAKKLL